jgi:hypothetical protein
MKWIRKEDLPPARGYELCSRIWPMLERILAAILLALHSAAISLLLVDIIGPISRTRYIQRAPNDADVE